MRKPLLLVDNLRQVHSLQQPSWCNNLMHSVLQTAAATTTVASAVGSATKTMASMQKAMNPQQVNATMQQFAKVGGRQAPIDVCSANLVCLGWSCALHDWHSPVVLYAIISAKAENHQLLIVLLKENAKMDMTSEMVGDAIDDALDDDEVEEETNDMVSQVSVGVE